MNTIAELLPAYLDYLLYERMAAAFTVTAYRSDLLDLARACPGPLEQIGTTELREYMRNMSRRGLSAATIRRRFHGFGTFWRWLRLEHIIRDNPLEGLTLPRKYEKLPRWLSLDELRRFVVGAPYPNRDRQRPAWALQRDLAAFRLMAWLGLRRGEIVALKCIDVHIDERLLIVRSGKGNKDRLLAIPAPMLGELAAQMKGRAPDAYVFPGLDGGRWKVRAFNHAFKVHLKACGLPSDITPHALRHTFASSLHDRGVGLAELQLLLGHADIKSTVRYTHISQVRLNAALEKHPLFELGEANNSDGKS